MEEQFNPLGSITTTTVVDTSLQQKPSIALRSIANSQRPAVSIEPGSTLSLPASEQRLRQQPYHLHPLLQSSAIATGYFAGCAGCERALRNIAQPKGLLEKTRISRKKSLEKMKKNHITSQRRLSIRRACRSMSARACACVHCPSPAQQTQPKKRQSKYECTKAKHVPCMTRKVEQNVIGRPWTYR